MACCSVCGKTFDLDQTPARPFCSVRCKEIDLGRWLGERYGLAIETEGEPSGDPPPQADRS